MESVLAALKETPIPTILVLAGIVFLLLSMVGQLVGHVTVPPERQRWAAVTGGALLIAGIGLHVIPLVWPSAPGIRNDPISRSSTPLAEEQSPSPSTALPRAQLPPKSDVGTSSVQTTTRGIVASITRFQKRGVARPPPWRSCYEPRAPVCSPTPGTHLERSPLPIRGRSPHCGSARACASPLPA